MKFEYKPLDVNNAEITINNKKYMFRANAEGIVSALIRIFRKNLSSACLDIENDTAQIYYENNKILLEDNKIIEKIDMTLIEFAKIIHDAYRNSDISYQSNMKEIPIKNQNQNLKAKTTKIAVGNFYSKEIFFMQLDDLKEFID